MKRKRFILLSASIFCVSLMSCETNSPIVSHPTNTIASSTTTRTDTTKPTQNTGKTTSSNTNATTPAPTSANTSVTTSPDSNVSPSTTNVSSSTTEENKKMELFMFGDLYINQIRSIYVKFAPGVSGDVEWTSSDPSIVTVEGRPGPLPECLLHSLGKEGKVTITATVPDLPDATVSKEITIAKGEEMPTTIFDSLKFSSKFSLEDKTLSYDSEYKKTVDDSYKITTIFEENKDTSVEGIRENLTDAYQLTEENEKTGELKEYKYVRSNGNQVSKEKIDLHNEIAYELVKDDDDNTLNFDSSYYTNPFGNSATTTASDWQSFDGGKTYHYVGGYLQASYINASILLVDISPDDMFIGVKEDGGLTYNVIIDPYNSKDDADVKYGREVTGTIGELGKAKIDHITPYKHEAYHDTLQAAFKTMAQLKNYKVSFKMDYPDTGDDAIYDITLTENTIDQKVTTGDGKVSHTGIHKKDAKSYYSYLYDDEKKELTIDKEYSTAFDAVNRYPTFDFAAEIFADQVNGIYSSRSNNGIFILYCLYAPKAMTYYTYDQEGTLELTSDKKYVSKIGISFNAMGDEASLSATYSDFTTAKVDIDFSKISTPEEPTSWETDKQAAPLYAELKSWNIDKYVPYMYVKQGWSDSIGWVRSYNTPNAYLSTEKFDTEADLEKFIASYQKLLVENGYTQTTEKDSHNSDGLLFTKGEAKLSIAKEVNSWNGKITLAAQINVYAPDIVENGSNY